MDIKIDESSTGSTQQFDEPSMGQSLVYLNCETSRLLNYSEEAFNESKAFIEQCSNPVMKNALSWNLQKRQHLISLAEKLSSYLKKVQNQIVKLNAQRSPRKRKICKFGLGIPYFKDKEQFPCPQNPDFVLRTKQNQFLLHTYSSPHCWFKHDQELLITKIVEDIINARKREIALQLRSLNAFEKDDEVKQEIYVLENEAEALSKKHVVKSIIKNWFVIPHKADMRKNMKQDIINEIGDIEESLSKKSTQKKLRNALVLLQEELEMADDKYLCLRCISDFDGKLDWLTLSMHLNGRHNDMECKIMWKIYLHPNINKKPWTQNQEIGLQQVATKYKCQNWSAIANELDFNRSEYQCCIHYHSKLNDKFSKDKWSTEEEDLLLKVIEDRRTGTYIPWGKISMYYNNRTRAQIYRHFKSLTRNKKVGKFSQSEETLFSILINGFKDLHKIKEYFPNRTFGQLKDKLRGKDSNQFRTWTLEEDIEVIEHVNKHGEKNWTTTNIRRAPSQIRHRYNTLKNWIFQNPDKSIEFAPRRNVKCHQDRNSELNACEKVCFDKFQSDMKLGKITYETVNLKYIEEIMNAKKDTIKRKRTTRQKEPIDDLLVNFFKVTNKPKGRKRSQLDEKLLKKTAVRVKGILKLLGADLDFPDEETLRENPYLDEFDIDIITDLQSPSNQSDQLCLPSTSRQTVTIPRNMLVPPNYETIVGLRGMLLHRMTLLAHSHGLNSIDTKQQMWNSKNVRILREMLHEDLEKINDNQIQMLVIRDQDKFWHRFKLLFKWPSFMTYAYNDPNPPASRKTGYLNESELDNILTKQVNGKKKIPHRRKMIIQHRNADE